MPGHQHLLGFLAPLFESHRRLVGCSRLWRSCFEPRSMMIPRLWIKTIGNNASIAITSAADEDRSRVLRSGGYVRREPLNEGARAQGAEAIDLKQPRISQEETHDP
jgi:hypothetical protein